MSNGILEYIKNEITYLDGGMGTLLQGMGLAPGELPELWNVLKGDMSLVGPRPLPTRYLPRYTPEQARRHEVRPGITGWAQIHGRNALFWEEKFRYDVEYVDRRSLALDLWILAATAFQVVFPRHIAHDGEATMPEFTGVSDARVGSVSVSSSQ